MHMYDRIVNLSVVFCFFNDTATTEIYTLSLTRRSSDLPGAGLRRQRARAPGPRRGPDYRRSVSVFVAAPRRRRSEEHTSELQSRQYLVCRLLLEKKKHPEEETLPVVYRILCYILISTTP